MIYNSEFKEYKDVLGSFLRLFVHKLRTGNYSADQISSINSPCSTRRERCSDIQSGFLATENRCEIEMSEINETTMNGEMSP